MTWMAAGKPRQRDREEREEIAYQSPSVKPRTAVPHYADRRRCTAAETSRAARAGAAHGSQHGTAAALGTDRLHCLKAGDVVGSEPT